MIVHRYDVLDSTNLKLMEMAAQGAPAWTTVIADSQSGGMGRSGNAWWSPPGGLYMSILIREIEAAGQISRVPILAALAVLDALGETAEPVRVKWPNDVLAGERKLAGILIQARTEGKKVLWIVAGFGINVQRPEGDAPEGVSSRIAYAQDLCPGISRDWLARSLAEGLRDRLSLADDDSWREAMEEWTRSASWKAVYTHRDGKREIRGVPLRLAWDGGLVLGTDAGEITVHSGEIIEAVQS